MTDWSLTLLIAVVFSALVFGGTLYYLRGPSEFSKSKKFTKAGIWAAAAFAGVCLIYWLTEYVGEL